MRIQRLASLFVGLALSAVSLPAAERSARPNVVFILADDLGWRDNSLYGSTFYETPNIERLARRGMKFANAYAANPTCSPTRASILTGLYPARIGITTPCCSLPEVRLQAEPTTTAAPNVRALQPNSATRLATNYFTLAESLKAAGYATGHFGKWHLGPEPFSPLQQGFDVDVPHYFGPGPAGGYLGPWTYPRELDFVGKPGEHVEDRMAQEAVKFIKANQDRSFFLNYWAFSVHAPYNAKPELIEKYRKKAELLGDNAPQRNPIYGAMVQSLDENIGLLLDTLDELKLADRTIIVFFSDNGGVNWTSMLNDPVYQSKRFTNDFRAIPLTSNAPLRGGKATLYEGGTREPCVVVWPGAVRADSASDALVSSVDFYPTILEMLGLKPQAGQKFDGVSQVATLRGRTAARDAVFCYFPHLIPVVTNFPGTWVRRGDWKLIRFHCDNTDQSDRFELYNLQADIGETNNLAAKQPAKVKELNALIDGFFRETKAYVPQPNPNYRLGSGKK